MGDIVFKCEFCAHQLVVDEQGIGLEVPCPSCNRPIVIPENAIHLDTLFGIHPTAETEPLSQEDHALDEERTKQMLSLLQEVVQDTSRVEHEIAALTSSPDAASPGSGTSELQGEDPSELLANGLSLLKSKLGLMTHVVETTGQRIRELTQLSDTLKNKVSEGEADKRRLKEEISDLTKSSSQRIALDATGLPPTPSPVPLDELLPAPSTLPLSIWRSKAFLSLFAFLLLLVAGSGYLFYAYKLPDVLTATPHIEVTHRSEQNTEEAALEETLSFGSARVRFATPYQDTADSALLGAAPPGASENRFLVLPVDLTNASASQPIYLKYLWADTVLVSKEGLYIKPISFGAFSPENLTTQTMEPGSAITVNLTFPIPSTGFSHPVLYVFPGIWSRDVKGRFICDGRPVRLRLTPPQAKVEH